MAALVFFIGFVVGGTAALMAVALCKVAKDENEENNL